MDGAFTFRYAAPEYVTAGIGLNGLCGKTFWVGHEENLAAYRHCSRQAANSYGMYRLTDADRKALPTYPIRNIRIRDVPSVEYTERMVIRSEQSLAFSA